MKIVVYDCVSGDALTEKYGRTGDQVIRWIAPHFPEAIFTSVHVAGGERLPDPAEVDGIIVSGSEKGVYDDVDWMHPLRQNLLNMRAAAIPMFGICFGHQIMADVFGGKAEKSDQGFVTGARSFKHDAGELNSYLAHQDQVTQVPPGARVVASADYCPVAALAYDFPALSVQFHPEYTPEFTHDLIDMFGAKLMSKEEMSAARATVPAEVPANLYCAEVCAFFRGHHTSNVSAADQSP